ASTKTAHGRTYTDGSARATCLRRIRRNTRHRIPWLRGGTIHNGLLRRGVRRCGRARGTVRKNNPRRAVPVSKDKPCKRARAKSHGAAARRCGSRREGSEQRAYRGSFGQRKAREHSRQVLL